MSKIANRLEHTKKNNLRHAWSIANRFYDTQMIPLLQYIINTTTLSLPLSDLYSKTFKKYLVISCVGLIDKFMTLKIRTFIDEQDIDISKFNLRLDYEKMLKKYVEYPDATKGQCVVVQQDFTNADIINKIATLVLKQNSQFQEVGMDFFDAVKKIDWYDPYKYVKGIEGVKPLSESWDNFMRMFKLRNNIVHEMNDNPIPVDRLACMCDSTMNFIDATDFIFGIEYREDVLERLASRITLREKNAAIDRAMDKAIEKGKVPPDMIKKLYEQRAR